MAVSKTWGPFSRELYRVPLKDVKAPFGLR